MRWILDHNLQKKCEWLHPSDSHLNSQLHFARWHGVIIKEYLLTSSVFYWSFIIWWTVLKFYILVGLSFLWRKRLNWKELNLHLPILQNDNIVKWQRQKRQPAIKSLLEIPNRARFQITLSKFQFSQSGSFIWLKRRYIVPRVNAFKCNSGRCKDTATKFKFPFEAHTIFHISNLIVYDSCQCKRM